MNAKTACLIFSLILFLIHMIIIIHGIKKIGFKKSFLDLDILYLHILESICYISLFFIYLK